MENHRCLIGLRKKAFKEEEIHMKMPRVQLKWVTFTHCSDFCAQRGSILSRRKFCCIEITQPRALPGLSQSCSSAPKVKAGKPLDDPASEKVQLLGWKSQTRQTSQSPREGFTYICLDTQPRKLLPWRIQVWHVFPDAKATWLTSTSHHHRTCSFLVGENNLAYVRGKTISRKTYWIQDAET